MKYDDNLFYTCALIECIGREVKLPRGEVVSRLGEDVRRIYTHADVFHCEPLEKVAWDFIERDHLPTGHYDVTANVPYAIPDCWDIGEVFERLIEDCFAPDEVVEGIKTVFTSWIAPAILNFRSDLYYQPREYLAACYREGAIIAA